MQVLYGYFSGNSDNPYNAEKEVVFSIQKSHHLFFHLINLIIEVSDHSFQKIENARQKKLPTQEDLNPSTRFIDNKVVELFRKNSQMQKFLKDHPYSWKQNEEIVKKIYQQITSSGFYNEYMTTPAIDINKEKRIITEIYTEIIAKSEDIIQSLEEDSIFWNDDFEFIISYIVKVISGIKENEKSIRLPGMFSHPEDEKFVKDLLLKTIANHDENEKMISSFTRNWDVERIAQLDILLMEMAITEFLCMPEVPVKVSLNEYIELSKYYSTDKSWAFINGVLDKIIESLRKEKKIEKRGKGLLGEPDIS